MKKWAPYLVAGVVLLAVVLPGLVPGRSDSFPLSIYPMYAWARPEVVDLPTAVLQTPTGDRDRLSVEVIGGVDDPLVATAAIRTAVGAGTAEELCREIAARVERAGTVQIVFERHNLIDFLDGSTTPLKVTVYAGCLSG